MSKEIKAFITNDSFINNLPNTVSPIFELSDIALTYSKEKQIYHSTADSLYSLYVFKQNNNTLLTQNEVNNIINVIISLNSFLTRTQITDKQQIIISFINSYNSANSTNPVNNLSYNNIVSVSNIHSVDYLTFTIDSINCSIWLSDSTFRIFYPDYEINIIPPFNNFNSIINNTSEFITALDTFDLLNFNIRIEENKGNNPTTYTKILNIPYKVPNTAILKNCYFAFNIYGQQGNYDFILKLNLYNYLTTTLNIASNTVESLFPTILNINEFFIIPRWDKIAIPSQVGQASINSQIASTFNEIFDINKFIKIYTDNDFLKNNTYSVPFDYNNILLYIINGFYSESSIKDFKNYFNDFITVTSTHPDFARMKLQTQKFVTLLENMLNISNCNNSVELFNNIVANINYKFTTINRGGINYLSYLFDKHQIYLLPKYEFISLI